MGPAQHGVAFPSRREPAWRDCLGVLTGGGSKSPGEWGKGKKEHQDRERIAGPSDLFRNPITVEQASPAQKPSPSGGKRDKGNCKKKKNCCRGGTDMKKKTNRVWKKALAVRGRCKEYTVKREILLLSLAAGGGTAANRKGARDEVLGCVTLPLKEDT